MNNYLPKNLDLSAKEVSINKTSLLSLAEKHGTPLYVYDWKHILDNLAYFRESFGEETIFRYAAKAFICKAFVKETDTGLGNRRCLRRRNVNSERINRNTRDISI